MDAKKYMKTDMLKAETVSRPAQEILKRVALPFLLFSAVLLGFLLLSYFLVLPQLTRVEVAGGKHDTATLKSHVSDLQQRVNEMDKVRRELIMPLQDGLYGSAKAYKLASADFSNIESNIQEISNGLVPGKGNAVIVRKLHFIPSRNLVELEGFVQAVGPQSMTVLAQFVDRLKKLEGVASLTPPLFTREHDPERGYISPFSFQIFLQ